MVMTVMPMVVMMMVMTMMVMIVMTMVMMTTTMVVMMVTCNSSISFRSAGVRGNRYYSVVDHLGEFAFVGRCSIPKLTRMVPTRDPHTAIFLQ